MNKKRKVIKDNVEHIQTIQYMDPSIFFQSIRVVHTNKDGVDKTIKNINVNNLAPVKVTCLDVANKVGYVLDPSKSFFTFTRDVTK